MQYSVRISKETGNPELFFYESRELLSYSRMGEHSPADVHYMRSRTRPAKTADESNACDRLARFWLSIPGAENVPMRRVERLRRL